MERPSPTFMQFLIHALVRDRLPCAVVGRTAVHHVQDVARIAAGLGWDDQRCAGS